MARPVFGALASPASSVPGSVVPRLGNAFAAMTVPVLLISDDVHVLRNQECQAELIRAHLTLGDLAGARTIMREIDEILRRRPGLGTLVLYPPHPESAG